MKTHVPRIAKISKVALAIPWYAVAPQKRKYAAWLKREIEGAGCLAVKIGQWVSSRTDVFPPALTEELGKLRTNVSPMARDTVHSIVSSELGVNYLEWFDDIPVSTGSIAQVHRGIYEGQEVAIKIQRPGLQEELVDDIKLLQWLLTPYKWLNPKMYQDVHGSLVDLVATVKLELNFPLEAQHMTHFGDFFDPERVRVPRVLHVTPRTIVMEYVPSIPVLPLPPTHTAKTMANMLMDLFFQQFFELGYVHTDLHEGNVGLCVGGGTECLVLYDFGSVLKCPENLVLCIKHLMVAYMNRNTPVMLDYLLEYGVLVPSTLSPEERVMMQQFLEAVVVYAEESGIETFAAGMQRIDVPGGSTISFQPELFMILRSFTLLEGLCKELDSSFIILDAVLPLVSYFATDPLMYRLKIEDDLRTFISFFQDDDGA